MLATVRYLTRVGGGHSRLMWWTGRRTIGGWVSLFEEKTSGALGGAPYTTPNDNCDDFKV